MISQGNIGGNGQPNEAGVSLGGMFEYLDHCGEVINKYK